jgi:peptidoglycan/LPS O-acetylase OafA/YrhL
MTDTHWPQLDGVRAAAIGIVLLAHLAPPDSKLGHSGEIGVRIFFVLSGFLITGILLRVRDASLKTGQSLLISLRQFYLRRALRIFPVFYIALAAGVAAGLLKYPDALPWMIAYVGNWYTVIYGRGFGWLNAFWTLWIEEQFYFVWPFLVFCAPRRFMIPGAVCIVALSIAYRLFASVTNVPFTAIYENTVTSVDALVLGAILAMLHSDKIARRRLAIYGWAVALPVMAIYSVMAITGHGGRLGNTFVMPVATAFLGLALVDRAATGGRWALSRILENPAVRWLGAISYGLYAYHEVVHGMLINASRSMGYLWTDSGIMHPLLWITCSFVVTVMSYYLMERPLSARYKHRIRYVTRA